jgi:hypothetical protein
MSAEQIVLSLSPFLVFGATELVKLIFKSLPGWAVVSIIVPVLSLAVTFVAQYLAGLDSFLLQAIVGLLAVFLNELMRQLKQATPNG